MGYPVNLGKPARSRIPQHSPGTEASWQQKKVPWITTAPHPRPYEVEKLAPIPGGRQSQDSRYTPRNTLSWRWYRPPTVWTLRCCRQCDSRRLTTALSGRRSRSAEAHC